MTTKTKNQMNEPILQVDNHETLKVGLVYVFRPIISYSRLVLLKQPSTKSACICLVRRKSLLVVLGKEGNWRNIICSGFEGWINVSNVDEKSNVFTVAEQISRYEDWKGNNHIMCGGQVVMGSDRGFFVLTNVLLLVPEVLFLVFVVTKTQHVAAYMVCTILYCACCGRH